jgi:hypothetical protein
VARDEHGPALGPERPDQLADLHDPGGVQAVGGLVQDQHGGILEQGGCDPQPLLHPERVRPREIARSLGEPHAGERAVDVHGTGAVQQGQDLEVAPAREPGIQGRLLDDRADASDHRGQPTRQVGTEQAHPAGRGAHQAEHAPDGGGLPGPVGTEEPEDTALRHVELQPVHRDGTAAAQPSVLLAEPLDLDDPHPGATIPGASPGAARRSRPG